jgi:hypothetical protein
LLVLEVVHEVCRLVRLKTRENRYTITGSITFPKICFSLSLYLYLVDYGTSTGSGQSKTQIRTPPQLGQWTWNRIWHCTVYSEHLEYIYDTMHVHAIIIVINIFCIVQYIVIYILCMLQYIVINILYWSRQLYWFV